MEQFPSATTLHDATCQSLLSGCTQQTPIEVAEVAFSIIVGTRQTGHAVAVEQSGGVADIGLLDGLGQVTLMINRPHLRFADARAIFDKPEAGLHIDVFYEKLDFCHVISWEGRLEVDAPTIPLAEMLLEKMQIVQINEKDVIDTLILLLEHPLGDKDDETINIEHIAGLCGNDWGLWRTTTMNLDKVRLLAQGYDQLTTQQKAKVASQVTTALARLEREPKSLAWRLRARVGDRVKWYKDVDEVH